MRYEHVEQVIALMTPDLKKSQLKRLRIVLETVLPITKCPYDTDELIEHFKQNKRLVGIKETTLKTYEQEVRTFCTYLGSKALYEVEAKDITNYFEVYSATHTVRKSTIANKIRFLSSFYDYMEMQQFVEKNPCKQVEKVRVERVKRDAFSDADMKALRACCKTKRDKALIEFMYSTGCRVSEISGLKLNKVDLDKGECVVFGKGHKERTVYMSATCVKLLKSYLKGRKKKKMDSYLFTAREASEKPLGNRCIQKRLREMGEESGVEHVHPHKFRRTFATHALKNGMTIEQIQEILGHSRIDTTMIYVNVDNEKTKAEFKKCFK